MCYKAEVFFVQLGPLWIPPHFHLSCCITRPTNVIKIILRNMPHSSQVAPKPKCIQYEIPRTGYQCQCHRPSGGERGSCWGSWLCFWKHHALLLVLLKLILCLYYPNLCSLSLELSFLLAHFLLLKNAATFQKIALRFWREWEINWMIGSGKIADIVMVAREVRCDACGLVLRYLCKIFLSNLRGRLLQPNRGRYL